MKTCNASILSSSLGRKCFPFGNVHLLLMPATLVFPRGALAARLRSRGRGSGLHSFLPRRPRQFLNSTPTGTSFAKRHHSRLVRRCHCSWQPNSEGLDESLPICISLLVFTLCTVFPMPAFHVASYCLRRSGGGEGSSHGVYNLRFPPANFLCQPLFPPEDDTLKKKMLFLSGTKSLLEWLLSKNTVG